MAHKQIHIVMGFTGEYEDKSYWQVAAYLDKKSADRRADSANDWLIKNNMHMSGYTILGVEVIGTNPFDKNMVFDYATGATYSVVSIPLTDWSKR